jgi:hypothetical protein
MNTVPPLPPRTSLTDVILLFGSSLVAAAVWHLIRGQRLRLSEEAKTVAKRCSASASNQSGLSDGLFSTVRKFHRSMVAFILSWLPFLVLVIGNTCCSLLRDAGYLIFPWPLLTVGLLFGFALWVAQRTRLRLICRLIFPGPDQHLPAAP